MQQQKKLCHGHLRGINEKAQTHIQASSGPTLFLMWQLVRCKDTK